MKQSHYIPTTGPEVLQEDEAHTSQDKRHMKVVRLLALRTAHLYPQEMFLLFIFIRS